jgi:predicted HicB family RNase H-like nuclease
MKNKQGAPLGSQNALKNEVVASEHIHIRVLPDLKAAAKAQAKADGISFSEWITNLVTQATQL